MIEWLGAQGVVVSIVVGLVGLVMLVLAADLAVGKLVALAEYAGLSATFMGMTVASLATSIPEITAHVTASAGILSGALDYRVSSAIVLGANIGSDVVQQTLIMGLVVMLVGQLYFRRYFLLKSLVPMILTALVCLALGMDGLYSRLDGAILFGLFVAYTYFLYADERKHHAPTPAESEDPPVLTSRAAALKAGAVALVAMLVTVLAAQLVLSSTEVVVAITGLGGSLIGVVTLGVASALPELTTAVAGARKNAQGISLGTLVGSNITNPLVGIGLGALVSTYWVPRPFLQWDLPWQAGSGALLLVWLWFRKGRLGRPGAIYLVSMYVVYILFRVLFFSVD